MAIFVEILWYTQTELMVDIFSILNVIRSDVASGDQYFSNLLSLPTVCL